jgi:hypothetical protein
LGSFSEGAALVHNAARGMTGLPPKLSTSYRHAVAGGRGFMAGMGVKNAVRQKAFNAYLGTHKVARKISSGVRAGSRMARTSLSQTLGLR